jgi:hypothetical protein
VSGTAPSGLVFHIARGKAVLSGTPAADASGTYHYVIAASAKGGRMKQFLTLSVDQVPAFTPNSSVHTVAFKTDKTPVKATGYPTTALIYGRPSVGGSDDTHVITLIARNPAGVAREKVNVTIVNGQTAGEMIVDFLGELGSGG